ncbi:hypothetical protein [Pseudocolwellia agarivorans]|uniref:hypothetical protein n=1 Tax=Pseudocolwellia agarivorans TaxID=1911682 RepID=UPI000985F801|nr:hypothetical protein [Pseudocolwellia agarivorans]
MKIANSPCFALFAPIIISFVMMGCSPETTDTKASLSSGHEDKVEHVKVKKVSVNKSLEFAVTVDESRSGLWLGGSPPINKRASGIDTYYKMSVGSKPNRLLVTLQFERVTADDAYISFNALDGAEISLTQPLKYKLKANKVSEVTFEVAIPETPSYLALYTFQNGRGASRAFKLKETKHL